MRNTRCLFSTAAALHRVFVAPIEQPQFRVSRHRIAVLSTSLSSTPTPRPLQLSQPQRRYAATSAPADKRRLPRDEEISSWFVSLVTQDRKLSEPQSTKNVLANLDRKTQSLVVIVPGEPGVPPICKIMDKKQMRDSEKAKAKAARGSGVTTKTLELNWAIDGNDLGHRLKKMKEFLGKGNRVEVLLAGKKKGRKATEEEGTGLLAKLREGVSEVEGAKESKPMEGKLLGQVKLYFEGTMDKKKNGLC